MAQRQYWCRLIKEKFNEENNQVSPDDPKANEELLRLLIQKVNNLESAAASHVERDRNLNEALEENKIQKSELAAKDKAILQKDKHIKKLERMLYAAQQPSPKTPVHSAESPVGAARKRPLPIPTLAEEPEVAPAAKKKKKKASTTAGDIDAKLVGVEEINTTTVGGILVSTELDRIHKIIVNKSKELESDEVLSKEVLFDRIHTDTHMHPAFKNSSELAKYDAGMTFVAVAISDDDWKKLCAGELNDEENRNLFMKIQKDTMLTAIEWENRLGKSTKLKSKASIHSLGGRFKALITAQKETNPTFDMDTYVRKNSGQNH